MAQKKIKFDVTRQDRASMIQRTEKISISRQCELLSLNRTGIYYAAAAPSDRELRVKRYIDEIYTGLPFYGCRRISRELFTRHGFNVDKDTVSKYMREMGIFAIYPKPDLSKSEPEHKIYPYLLKNLIINRPNQVWAADTTYIRLLRGFMYLTAIMDWYSRYVVSWILADTLAIEPILEAARGALAIAQPEIMNTDQGGDFTSLQFTHLFMDRNVSVSMDHRGRCFDNIMVERLWRSVKYEKVYISELNTPKEANKSLADYFVFYNNRRPHQSLDNNYPADVYSGKVKLKRDNQNSRSNYKKI
jgi:putative transposase